jgi:phenylalanyl-tRNA synthetase beta chain
MRISVKWLKDYIDLTVPAEELAILLTMAGNEVKAVENVGSKWDKVFVGEVLAVEPHPNADRLRLVTVDIGSAKPTVVCGATNFKVCDKIAFAVVGAELIDGHSGQSSVLKAAKIRGVESRGMICSEFELGISAENSGILVLPAEAPIGKSLKEFMGDSIIDLDVTPNRPDCLSVIGIAREASALTGRDVKVPEINYNESGTSIENSIKIEIQAADLCPRYCASLVRGIIIKPSPMWMQERLKAAGMRPINNIVDISNFVMLEYGQPLHTFDYDRLAGTRIIVRRASNGEKILSLDGIERELDSRMLVIADAEKAVAVAGVMGGANSEVSEQTVNILVEAASFKATSVHNTGTNLGLSSEARYRFERGIAPGLTLPALKRATQLISELGGGKVAPGIVDVYPGELEHLPIEISTRKIGKLLGADLSIEQIEKVLVSLGMKSERAETVENLMVTAPYWRSDINIQEDLIEEVARISGYDKIPNTLLADPLPQLNPDPIFNLKKEVRKGLAASGFSEVLNFSMIGMEQLKKLSPHGRAPEAALVRLANPMTAEMEYLRTSFRANLLSAFASNRRFQDGSIRLFEVGKIYLGRDKAQPDERDTLCAVMGGLRNEKSWQENREHLDFFDAKGIAEGLLGKIGLGARFESARDEGLHPSQQAGVMVQNARIGVMGQIHPRVLTGFEISETVFLLELDLKSVLKLAGVDKIYLPLPKYPSIVRDLALTVPASLAHDQIESAIRVFPLVEEVQIFDVYAGEQVSSGKKSMAYRLSFRSPDHTLTDEEANQVQQQILTRLNQQFGAVLRE